VGFSTFAVSPGLVRTKPRSLACKYGTVVVLCLHEGDKDTEKYPNPRRLRYSVSRSTGEGQKRSETSPGDVSSPSETLRWSDIASSTVLVIDEQFWRDMETFWKRLLGKDGTGLVSRVGGWILKSARRLLGSLIRPVDDAELVNLENAEAFGELEMEYGIVPPNAADKYYVDPLLDWQLSNVAYYYDSFGNKVGTEAFAPISPAEFREMQDEDDKDSATFPVDENS